MGQEIQKVGTVELTEAMIAAGVTRLCRVAGLHLEQIEDQLPKLVEEVLRASLHSANLLGPASLHEEQKRSAPLWQ
jgi:hypothetical protein